MRDRPYALNASYQALSRLSPDANDPVGVHLDLLLVLFLVVLVFLLWLSRGHSLGVVLVIFFDAGHAVDVFHLLPTVGNLSSQLVMDLQDILSNMKL